MPIDVSSPGSDGWWLERCYRAMHARGPRPTNGQPWETRAQRLERLWCYYEGNPPLPEGASNARKAIQDFQRKARANYASLCVEAALDRQKLLGVRTVTDHDVDGDDLARQIASANGLGAVMKEVLLYRAVMGEGYAMVGEPVDGIPVITAEDPRQTITLHDPARPSVTRAGLKLYRDDDAGLDVAHLLLPGRVMVATRPSTRRDGTPRVVTSARGWEWDDSRSGSLPAPVVPLIRFRSLLGLGDFEKHTDVLDRINHMLLQRLMVAVMQAFRQRAVKGDLPDTDDQGNAIDYDEVFPADPGALWQLPEGVDLWESAGVDLTPLLTSVRDDVKEFAACTRTPLYYLFPDAQNGSAEGASLMREGLTYRCEDGIELADPRVVELFRIAFLFAGDAQRARGELSTMWAPVERYSLAERADAAVKAKGSGVPTRSILSDVWQFEPEVVKRMEDERLTDLLLNVTEQPPPQRTAQPAPAQP